jgi:hypothetical protein
MFCNAELKGQAQGLKPGVFLDRIHLGLRLLTGCCFREFIQFSQIYSIS